MLQVLKDIFGWDASGIFQGRELRIFTFARRKISLREHLKYWVDKGIYIVCVASPISTLPQIYQEFATKNTQGLSLLTWASYLFLSFFWLEYGRIHKDRPIIFSQVLWIIIYFLGVIGIILYGK